MDPRISLFTFSDVTNPNINLGTPKTQVFIFNSLDQKYGHCSYTINVSASLRYSFLYTLLSFEIKRYLCSLALCCSSVFTDTYAYANIHRRKINKSICKNLKKNSLTLGDCLKWKTMKWDDKLNTALYRKRELVFKV